MRSTERLLIGLCILVEADSILIDTLLFMDRVATEATELL